MYSFIVPSVLLPVLAFATPLTLRSDSSSQVYTSSFTWNDGCGPSVACGPAMAGVHGQGTTAANNVTFAAGKSIVNGKGAGCGQCWHLQATADPFPTNGKTWGTPVVAIINDQCTDGGYCDQTDTRKLNTHYGKEVHFDLCGETGTAQQFFGALGMGVLTGYAQQVDCSLLHKGTQGSGAGNLVAPNGGGSPAATWKHQANGAAATFSIGASPEGLPASATSNIGSPSTGSPASPNVPAGGNASPGNVASPAGNGSPASPANPPAAANPIVAPWSNSTGFRPNGGQSNGGQGSGGQASGGNGGGGSNTGGGSSGGNSGGIVNLGTQPVQQGSHALSQPPLVQGGSQGSSGQSAPAAKVATPQGHSYGSMKGLEQAASNAASGGVDGMKKAMENYMQQALNGNAPDEGSGNGNDQCGGAATS